MTNLRHTTRIRREKGTALLISIFSLLLISAVAISLIVMAGMESTIDANYKSATQVYYNAKAGLEEGRGRLWGGNPQPLTAAGFPSSGAQLPTGQVWYITNPGSGETVDPKNLSSAYGDTEYQTEWGVPVSSATVKPYVPSVPPLSGTPNTPYKWVRITATTEKSVNIDVNGDGVLDSTTPLYFDGSHLNTTSTGAQALTITSLAVLPNGSQKLMQYIVGASGSVLVDSAVHTRLSQVMGDALNVTGFTDSVCSFPSTYGAVSGSSVSVPGLGNVTGSPTGVKSNALFPYDLPALIQSWKPMSQPIDSPGTGVTGSGNPVTYLGPHATLGTPPTVTYDANGGITAIKSPGSPGIYLSPGNLTLGVPTIGGAPVQGQGILLVQGNLTLDLSNGFNYFGLILVTGDIYMTANSSTAVTSNIHGTIIGGGKFISNLANLGGSIFIHQNACMVQSMLNNQPRNVLAFREISHQ